MAIAVFLGSRRTGGYDLAIDPAGQTDMAQLFRVRELAPAPDAFVPQVLTTPYRIFLLPMNAQPVLFLTGFNGAASGECLYIPSGERRRAESITQFLNKPICPEAPGQSSEGS
ncbi:MAG: protease complex subunit PrcB family protein [Proteobacteria bacterium]|nr:protease complex subunit PrcB family protein [Pseudomonadota bacterium]